MQRNDSWTLDVGSLPGRGPIPDAAQLRELAAHVLALAITVKDPQLVERLCVRAVEYLDQAGALEAAQASAADAEQKN